MRLAGEGQLHCFTSVHSGFHSCDADIVGHEDQHLETRVGTQWQDCLTVGEVYVLRDGTRHPCRLNDRWRDVQEGRVQEEDPEGEPREEKGGAVSRPRLSVKLGRVEPCGGEEVPKAVKGPEAHDSGDVRDSKDGQKVRDQSNHEGVNDGDHRCLGPKNLFPHELDFVEFGNLELFFLLLLLPLLPSHRFKGTPGEFKLFAGCPSISADVNP